MSHSPPAARVVADRSASPQSQRILLALAIALFISIGKAASSALIHTLHRLRIREPDVDFESDTTLAVLEKMSKVFAVVDVATMLAIAVCFTLLARKLWAARVDSRRHSGGVLYIVITATVFAFLDFVVSGGATALYIAGKGEWMFKIYDKRMLGFGLTLVNIGALATSLWALGAYAGVATERNRRVAWIGGLAATWSVGMSLYTMIDFIESPWWGLALSTLPALVAMSAMAHFAWSGRLSLGPLPIAEARADSRIRWLDASRSLGLYGTALLWRLVVAIGAYSLLYIALESQSFALVKFIGWALPLSTLVLGVVMTIGIVGFANQPRASRGREPAYGAAALMALGSAIDLVLFISLVRVLRGRADDISYKLQLQLEAIEGIAPWALILGFASLLLLLASFRAVARALGQHDLVARSLSVFFMILAGGAITVGLRLWIAGKPRLNQGEAMVVVVLILVVAGIVVASYLGLLRRLQQAVNQMALASHEDEV